MEFPLFDWKRLDQFASEMKETYGMATPFPHAVLEGALVSEVANRAAQVFPKPTDAEWFKYDNPLERKLATNRLEVIPRELVEILFWMNSGPFISFLEKLTGIKGLIADPHYNGGGLHQILPGGKLDVHVDYNVHRTLGLDRRLNVLLYLNPDWKSEWGGELELWNSEMNQCGARISPVLNRMAVFSTTETSWHGHPDPLQCPEGVTRKSIATYYYTKERPDSERAPERSTLFVRRPQDPEDAELEELRRVRAKGRLANLTHKA